MMSIEKKIIGNLGPEDGTITGSGTNPNKRKPRRNIRVRITNNSNFENNIVTFMATEDSPSTLDITQSLAWQSCSLINNESSFVFMEYTMAVFELNSDIGCGPKAMTVKSVFFAEGVDSIPHEAEKPDNVNEIYIYNYVKLGKQEVPIALLLNNGYPYSTLLKAKDVPYGEKATFTLNNVLYFGLTTSGNVGGNNGFIKKSDYISLSQEGLYDENKFFKVDFDQQTREECCKEMIIDITVDNAEGGGYKLSSEIKYI